MLSLHSKNTRLTHQVNQVHDPSRAIILDRNLLLINHRENSSLILFGSQIDKPDKIEGIVVSLQDL